MRPAAFLPILLFAGAMEACAQLEWIPSSIPRTVFAGRESTVPLTIHNTTDKSVEVPLRMRLFQLSAATSMPVDEGRPWKTLKLLPGQTVLESVTTKFPIVKARTTFEIQWSDAKGRSPGKTQVVVYPDDLLKQLATLAKDKPVGVIDSTNLLKPALKRGEVEFKDLETGQGLDKFEGPLAVVFSADSKAPQLRHLSERLAAIVKSGVAVVWIHPFTSTASATEPRAYPLRLGRGTLVVAQPSTVSNVNDSPASQLNLVHFAEIALNPDSLQFPETP